MTTAASGSDGTADGAAAPVPLSIRSPVNRTGVLVDDEILQLAERNELIVENFSPECVQQTCYELRAGDIYYDLSGGARRYELKGDEYVLLKPHQLAVIITLEELEIPADIVGRILMKGKLFSLGLQPVNTYADAGFKGRLGIVVHNSSPNYIRIDQGYQLAKIEFERLNKPVSRPYSGQHGFKTGIWPIPSHLVVERDQLKKDPRVGAPGVELRRAYGDEIGSVIDRVFRYERRLLLSVLAYVLIAVSLIIATQATGERLSVLWAFLIGLITNIVSSVLIFMGTRISIGRRRI
jgi:dCTP deaminase